MSHSARKVSLRRLVIPDTTNCTGSEKTPMRIEHRHAYFCSLRLRRPRYCLQVWNAENMKSRKNHGAIQMSQNMKHVL